MRTSVIMNKSENLFYASTGTFIGRANNFDYNIIAERQHEIDCDGFELMMLNVWYKKIDEIADVLGRAGVYTPVIHFDKFVGIMLAEGREEPDTEAMKLFRENVRLASLVGAKKAVFHLWGGEKSDSAVRHTLTLLPEMLDICGNAGITLMIENIPCVYSDPLSVWKLIAEEIPDIPLIFDTRFGAFHDQYMDIFQSPLWKNVKHVHVSSYNGVKNEWGLIRPILHPGEGKIDFDHLISNMPHYGGTVTLESPVLSDGGTLDLPKLNRSLSYLREKFSLYRPDLK